MRLDSIAVKHLSRRKGKSIFLLLIIVIAMGTVTGLYALATTIQKDISKSFDEIGPNIIIKPDDEGRGFSYGGAVIPALGDRSVVLTNDSILSIRTIPDGDSIALVAPKLLGQAKAEAGLVTVVGVDFPYEFKLKQWWTYLGDEPREGLDLLVGNTIAREFNWVLGQKVDLSGTEFKVAAILAEQGSDDDQVVFMQLLKAQELLHKKEQLSFIEVAAYCSTCPIDDIAQQLSTVLPGTQVVSLAEVLKAREEIVDRLASFALILSFVIIGVGTLTIFLNMISWVNERTMEIGIYRAIGFRQRNVFEIILTEALILGFLGGVLAYGGGISLARLSAGFISPAKIYIPWYPLLGFAIVFGSALLTVLASLYPAIKAAKKEPMEALRFI